jgi:hypothetical protein
MVKIPPKEYLSQIFDYCDGKGLGYFNTPEQAYQKVCEYRNYAHKDFSKN